MDEMKAAERPWALKFVDGDGGAMIRVIDAKGNEVATFPYNATRDEREARARLIVDAVNERDALKAERDEWRRLANVADDERSTVLNENYALKEALTNCADRLSFLVNDCKSGEVSDSKLSIAIRQLELSRAALKVSP